MRKKAIYFLFIISTFLLLFAQSQKISIAVLDFEALMIQDDEAKALTNRTRTELVKTGIYQVVERGQMDEILKEQGFQLSGCTSEACVVEAGQLLGVEKMLAGSVSKVGDIYSIELRLIDVGSGKIEKSDSYDMQGNIGQLLTSGMKNALDILLGNAPSQIHVKSVLVTEKPLKPQITTIISLTIGTLTDIDHNEYKTVKIGNQWWMAENLKVTHYRNGEAIPEITKGSVWSNLTSAWSNLTTGAYCVYRNDESNSATYGRLYNWYTVNDSRNIAPDGWHVPTDAEWTTLTTYLGGESVAGGKLKESGTAHWISPNTGATNESGFAALPGGYRATYGNFDDMGYNATFWSSTEDDSLNAWTRTLPYDYSSVARYYTNKRSGFSVRLVRD